MKIEDVPTLNCFYMSNSFTSPFIEVLEHPMGGGSTWLDRAASQWRRWLMEMEHETISVSSLTTRRRFIAARVE